MNLVMPRLLRKRLHTRLLAYLPRSYGISDLPVTVLIPMASKDLDKAPRAVASVRAHLRHPVSRIIIAGQDDIAIRDFCHAQALTYLNENEVLPPLIRDGDFRFGAHDARGWVRQQILKLTAFDYVDAERILVLDADTFLLRPLCMMQGLRQILFLADEYTAHYQAMTTRLLGPVRRYPRSFVCHSMLFQRDLMADMDRHILSVCGQPKVEAIVTAIGDGLIRNLSEYELYGNFVAAFHPRRFVGRYWYNTKTEPDNAQTLEQLQRRYARFNSVSAHLH